MNRRECLRGAGVVGGISLSGCLERLGFQEESVWRDPPVVEDRPAAVYLPASTEEMGIYGSATDGEYALELSYTFPHRFWTVAGSETNRVTVGPDDTHHLMCTVWDLETDTVLPVDVSFEILQDGEVVTASNLWSMLSQQMGFHYGENVILHEEGTYTASVRVGPLDATPTGDLEGRFDAASTLEIDFEYQRSDVHDLEFELIDQELHGRRDALELMEHGEHHESHNESEGVMEITVTRAMTTTTSILRRVTIATKNTNGATTRRSDTHPHLEVFRSTTSRDECSEPTVLATRISPSSKPISSGSQETRRRISPSSPEHHTTT